MTDASYKATAGFCAWVDRYLNFEKNPKKGIFWLETMRFLCEKLGNPQSSCRCIHVAGSKGKGSISRMIASIVEEYGLSCGIYSSPHIVDFEERISTIHGYFEDCVYKKSTDEVVSCVEGISADEWPGGRQPTWFELVTLYAFCCFRNAGVDFAVYEVGMGGRLDATNVVFPECCCINTIELEHTEYLGDTLELIAGEKAGIIKENVPVIIGWQKDDCVKDVFRKIAGEKKAPVVFAEKEASASVKGYARQKKDPCVAMEATLKSRFFESDINASLRLLGEFQAKNAVVAALAVKTVFKDISGEQIERGLAKACIPARFEILSAPEPFCGIKSLVLDGAHTVNSVRYTIETFKKVFGDDTAKEKAVLLFACASDKDVEDIAPCFKGSFASVFLTKPGYEKGSDLPRLDKAFESASIEHVLIEDCEKGIKTAFEKASKEKSLLLVTGSFYLVSEVRKLLW